MLDWLKRTLGVYGLTNAEGVPAEVLEALAQDCSRLKGSPDGSLPEIALKYVVDGLGDAPKAIAGVINNRGLVWTGGNQDAAAQKIRARVYDAWDRLPPEVLIRFGNVLAACSPVLAHRPRLLLAQKQPWIEALAFELLGLPVSHYGDTAPNPHPMASMARLEKLLESRSVPRSELIASTFRSIHAVSSWAASALYMRHMPDFAQSVVAYADAARPAFSAKAFEQRIYALNLLENVDAATLEPFAKELVALSLDSSRRVRQVAVQTALRLGEPALCIARQEAEEQKPEQRALALRLLWESGGEHEREFVVERGDRDSAESVRTAVQQLRSGAEAQENANATLQIPEVKADLSVPLSAESRDALRAALHRINDTIARRKEQIEKQNQTWAANYKQLSSSAIDTIVRQVAEPATTQLKQCEYTSHADGEAIGILLATWAMREDVRLTHVVRLLISLSGIQRSHTHHWHDYVTTQVLRNYGQRKPDASLLELAALLEACGINLKGLQSEWYGMGVNGFLATWPRDAIWPFFARYREMIDIAFNPPSSLANEYWFTRARVFDALETFPEVPADVVPRLMELALGSGKADRNGAQRALHRLPGKEDYIVDALASGKAETRAVAANWLAQLRYREAVPQLEGALKKEKHDVAAGALMSALEALGEPVDRFLDRGKLQEDAKRALAKGLPTDVRWFPFDSLPPVHWQDNGERLPDETLRWLIVQSCKIKSPEPGGVLRRYCASMRSAEREALGVFVLNAWLREDIKPIARADADKQARAQAQHMVGFIKQYPQYYNDDSLKNASEHQLYESYLPAFLRKPAGSAIASKGVLAVAAACGGPDIAPMVQRYLKEYYGTRAAQGKALIQMLAWVEHPTAIQLVLSVGSRFRTKGFQEEATRQAQLLAERKGWTLDELSDRTIPTAGFDEAGESIIDYGTRQFTARLTADFGVELYAAEGKKIANLPDARKDEDQAHVKELKKQFGAAKKELKGVLQLQRDRLYEGLCTQRRWRAEDWTLYLNRHPIVRRYCQQLVWIAWQDDQMLGVFRPLDDGTLTDVEDNAFELPADAHVALAHDSNLTPPVAAAWARHLQDYKVERLFQQLGKDTYRLPAQMRKASQLEEFKGYVLDAFTLRNRIGKLGYTRGAAEDGGWFFRYEKRFPTLGLTADIEFSGNGLPEENRKVALVALWFARSEAPGSYGVGKLPLGEIPGVLLSECWNDMRLLAAEATFDPEWEKKIQV
jgi:hypothetical protein